MTRRVTVALVAIGGYGSISSEGDAWEVTYVIPGAATLAVEKETTPDRLDVGDVQQHLRSRGIPLHVEEAEQ